MIKLKEIKADNLEDVLKLKVSKNQENFVSTTAYSLAQAYVYRGNAYPFAIYADDTLVGFIMFGFYELRNQYTLWKFLIDEKYQNKGYGNFFSHQFLRGGWFIRFCPGRPVLFLLFLCGHGLRGLFDGPFIGEIPVNPQPFALI